MTANPLELADSSGVLACQARHSADVDGVQAAEASGVQSEPPDRRAQRAPLCLSLIHLTMIHSRWMSVAAKHSWRRSVLADFSRRATRAARPAAGEEIDAGARNRDRISTTSGRDCRSSNCCGLSLTDIVEASAPKVSGNDLKFMSVYRCSQPNSVATKYFDSIEWRAVTTDRHIRHIRQIDDFETCFTTPMVCGRGIGSDLKRRRCRVIPRLIHTE